MSCATSEGKSSALLAFARRWGPRCLGMGTWSLGGFPPPALPSCELCNWGPDYFQEDVNAASLASVGDQTGSAATPGRLKISLARLGQRPPLREAGRAHRWSGEWKREGFLTGLAFERGPRGAPSKGGWTWRDREDGGVRTERLRESRRDGGALTFTWCSILYAVCWNWRISRMMWDICGGVESEKTACCLRPPHFAAQKGHRQPSRKSPPNPQTRGLLEAPPSSNLFPQVRPSTLYRLPVPVRDTARPISGAGGPSSRSSPRFSAEVKAPATC